MVPASQKKLHLELLRLLALCLVVYNHCGTCRMPTYAEWRLEYWYVLFMNICCKIAVPLFFMVSGALLLHREESYARILTHRVLRFVGLVLGFTLLQCVWLVYSGVEVPGVGGVVEMLYTGQIQGMGGRAPFVAWFLYAYLALLLFLPLLRRLAQGMRNADFVYMMCLQLLLVAALPAGVHALSGGFLEGELQRNLPFVPLGETVPFTAMYGAFYMLVGYYLEHRVRLYESPRRVGWLSAAAAGCVVLGCVMVNYHRATDGIPMPYIGYTYWCAFLLLPCVAVYLLAQRVAGLLAGKHFASCVVCLLGSGVFAALLTENIWRCLAGGIVQETCPAWHNYILYSIQMLVALVLSLAAGVLMKQIPYLRRWI